MSKTLVALVALALFGCATVGREISTAQVDTFKKGETTSAEAIQALGQPTGVTRMSDGRQQLIYSFAHAQARPASFIPIVGIFAGGTDVRSSSVVLTFDKAGIFQEYTSSQTMTGGGMGFAAGAYTQPDTTLPQEARSQ